MDNRKEFGGVMELFTIDCGDDYMSGWTLNSQTYIHKRKHYIENGGIEANAWVHTFANSLNT